VEERILPTAVLDGELVALDKCAARALERHREFGHLEVELAEPDLGDRRVGRGDRPGGRLRRDVVAEVPLDASACRESSDVLADGAVIDGGPTFDPPFACETDEALDRVSGAATSYVAPLLRQAEAGDAPALAGGADHVFRRHH